MNYSVFWENSKLQTMAKWVSCLRFSPFSFSNVLVGPELWRGEEKNTSPRRWEPAVKLIYKPWSPATLSVHLEVIFATWGRVYQELWQWRLVHHSWLSISRRKGRQYRLSQLSTNSFHWWLIRAIQTSSFTLRTIFSKYDITDICI